MATAKKPKKATTPAPKKAVSAKAKSNKTTEKPVVEVTTKTVDTPAAAESTDQQVAKNKPGRPPKAKVPLPPIEPIKEGMVAHLKLSDIDVDDHTFMFRANLRTEALEASLVRTDSNYPSSFARRRMGGSRSSLDFAESTPSRIWDGVLLPPLYDGHRER